MGLALGFIAFFTPGLFSITTLTAGIFSGRTDKAHGRLMSVFYSFFIIALFASAAWLLVAASATWFPGNLTGNGAYNIITFVVLILLSVRMLADFGTYLRLPLINLVDVLADSLGPFGIFFMAISMIINTLECTALIIAVV